MSYFSSYFTNLSCSNLSQTLEKLSRTCLIIPVARMPHPLDNQLEYTGDVTGLLYAVCIHRKHVLLLGFDELPDGENDWLADEEDFQGEPPLYFSESGHRTSPVFLMKLLRSYLSSSLPEGKYDISILLVCNYPIVNEEDMWEDWEDDDIRVLPSCRSITGLKAGSMDMIKDETLSEALLQLYEQCVPDMLGAVQLDKEYVTEDQITDEKENEEDEFEKLLNDFIASELEDDDSEVDTLPHGKELADITVKGTWREIVDKESALFRSLEQLDWEVAYGSSKFQPIWCDMGQLEWVAWPEANLSVRVWAAGENDPLLFDYIEGAMVYLLDSGGGVLRKKKIQCCDIWKKKWAKVSMDALPLQGDCASGEWIDGKIRIVKDEVELAVLPLRWMYLPPVSELFLFHSFQLYRNVLSVANTANVEALSCFARKGLHDILAVYRAKNIWEQEFPLVFRCRLYGEIGDLLTEKYAEASCLAGGKEIVASVTLGDADGITWKKARYLVEWRFRDDVVISAVFEVGRNDVPGIYQEDEISPVTVDVASQNSGNSGIDTDPWQELEALVGMDDFKHRMKELLAYRQYMDRRKNMGLSTPMPPLDMAFVGNSVRRKQEVARLLGRILHKLGFLSDGQVSYIDWKKFVQKSSLADISSNQNVSLTDNINAAKGGILLLDRISPPSVWDDNNSYRNGEEEAWTDLMSRLRDARKKDWVLVISGTGSMVQDTVNQFAELADNIPPQNWFDFTDYTQDELIEVARSYCRRHHYYLSEDAVEALRRKLRGEFVWTAGMGDDVEYIENLFTNEILEAMALRVSKLKLPTAVELMTIRKEDIPAVSEEDNDDMRKLKEMVGLGKLKNSIEGHLNMVRMMKWRMDKGLEVSMPPLHMIFLGNPGTGKTTVADFIGEIYASMGLLSKGKVIKVSRKDLVGQYLGHTERKTQEYLKRAKGNVLFIDEAYTLCSDENGKDFGHRVIEILLTVLDKDQVDMLVILAGYPEEMKRMIETNPGLPSRFPYSFYFNDYSVDELMQIARNYVKRKNFFFTPKAFQKLRVLVERQYEERDRFWGNARFIVRLISSQILPAMSNRLAALPVGKRDSKRLLRQICVADVQACDTMNQVEAFEEEDIQKALWKLDAMVGLSKVKEAVHNFVTVARYLQKRGQSYFREEPLRWSFVGNSGTGKSTVAGIMGEILRAMHVLNRGTLVELRAENLYNVPEYKVDEIIRNAMKRSEQGLLFVDGDAPMFKNPDTRFNGEELRFKLNSLMMELPGNYAVVIAEQTSYGRLQGDNGVQCVLPEMDHTFYFEDYLPEELMSILTICLEKRKLSLETEAAEVVKSYIDHLYENRYLGYANARTMSILARNIANDYLIRISRNRSTFDGVVIKEDVSQYVWSNVPVRRKIGFKL